MFRWEGMATSVVEGRTEGCWRGRERAELREKRQGKEDEDEDEAAVAVAVVRWCAQRAEARHSSL